MPCCCTTVKPVSTEYINHGIWNFHDEVILDLPPEQIYLFFLNDQYLEKWHPELSQVQWQTSKPYGVGTIRTVYLTHYFFYVLLCGSLLLTEEFIIWEPNQRISFRFNQLNRPRWLVCIAGTEDFQFHRLSDGKTKFTRTVSLDPSLLMWLIGCIVKPMLETMFRNALKRFREKVENKEFSNSNHNNNAGGGEVSNSDGKNVDNV